MKTLVIAVLWGLTFAAAHAAEQKRIVEEALG